MKKFYQEHGTKLIGSVVSAVGTLSALDPTLLQLVLGQRGLAIFTAVAGLLTVLRGKQNTKVIKEG